MHNSRSHFAGKTTILQVRTDNVLHGETEVFKVPIAAHVHRFQKLQHALSVIPGHPVRNLHHVIAFEGGDGNKGNVGDIELGGKGFVVFANLVENLLLEVHQIHFIYRQHHMLNAQQRYQVSMSFGLCDNSLAGIGQQDSEVSRGATSDHVAGVLLMPGGVGNDKLPLIGGKVAVGHIDGDTLFALGFEPVKQQGVVDIFAGMVFAFAVAFKGCQLIFVQHLAVEHQSPY